MFSIKRENIKRDQLLGRGSFGSVYPYQTKKDDKTWVIKVVEAKNNQELFAIMNEIVLGFSCDHPGIVPIKGYDIQELSNCCYDVYLKLPKMVESLKDRIERDVKEKKKYSEEEVVKSFYSLMCSVEYLHKKRIVHRDIKPGNILLDESGNLKLSDVGVAKVIDDGSNSTEQKRCGSLSYSAPEVKNDSHHLKKKDLFKADVWSLGLVMAEMCLQKQGIYNLKEPLPDREKELIALVEGLSVKYNEKLINLLLRMLNFDAKERISIQDAKNILEKAYTFLGNKKNSAMSMPSFKAVSEQEKEMNENQTQKILIQQKTIQDLEKEIETFKKQQESNKIRIQQRFKGQFQIEDETCIVNSLEGNQLQLLFAALTSYGVKKIAFDWKCHLTSLQYITEMMKYYLDTVQYLEFGFNRELSDPYSDAPTYNENTFCTDEGLKSLPKQIGENFKHLEGLSLDFLSCPKLTNKGIQIFSEEIGKNFESLQELNLQFRSNDKIDSTGIKSLAGVLGKIKSLKKLSLAFIQIQKFSDVALNILMEAIGNNLHLLRDLTLHLREDFFFWDFWKKPITDIGIKTLALQFSKELRSLQILRLEFVGCEDITDKGVMNLAKEIGLNLSKLQSLKLEFSGSKITDVGSSIFAEQIGMNLKTLKRLDLNFNCPALTDDSTRSFAEHFRTNLKDLNSLKLDLNKCSFRDIKSLLAWSSKKN